jgi:hypothetical protein
VRGDGSKSVFLAFFDERVKVNIEGDPRKEEVVDRKV